MAFLQFTDRRTRHGGDSCGPLVRNGTEKRSGLLCDYTPGDQVSSTEQQVCYTGAVDGAAFMGMSKRRAFDGKTGSQETGGHFADLEILDIPATIHESVTAPYDQSLRITARREFPDQQLRLPFPTTILSG
jgi:hypothetical protein